MILAAILAGGTGSRMGGGNLPKQFLPLGGKPILVRAAEQFLTHPQVEGIIVLAPASWLDFTRDLLDGHLPQGHNVIVAEGGKTRNDTLRRALDCVRERFGEDDHILLTHDAARPFVTHRIIGDNIALARAHGACATVVPACDTIMQSEDGQYISRIPPREAMYQAQTPQTFTCHMLRALMDALLPEEEATLTDACKIFALRGEPVALARGEASNIKITYPLDLAVAQAIQESGA